MTDPAVPRRPDVQIDGAAASSASPPTCCAGSRSASAPSASATTSSATTRTPYGDNRPGTAFNKTLLTSVTQFGADGAKFNAHTFRYHDEARDASGGYKGFAASGNWTVGNDGVSAGLFGKGAARRSAAAGASARAATCTWVSAPSTESPAKSRTGAVSRSVTAVRPAKRC